VERLKHGAFQLGFPLTSHQEEQFRCFSDQLIKWNRRVNLTAITDLAEIEELHFLDSLTLAPALSEAVRLGGRICDVGSGAGFPGVPLKIAFPGIGLTLVDSSSKRTRFLSLLTTVLGMEDVVVRTGRCEELAHGPELRESFDVVVARAVASLRVMAEYAVPFCRLGGLAILQKKGDIVEELAQAAAAWDVLGARVVEVQPVPSDVLGGERVLVVVEKVEPTPDRYPRRPGIPAKRPL
jgi:16S rRNA (guanine527-N7)-methyltransferase